MVKVGILGAGNIGGTHVRGYQCLANARVVAVDDIVKAKAENMAAPLQARAYDDWQAFLGDPEVEMVDICLPTYLHKQGVLAAAQAGKHILCEKPVALSLAQVDRMIAAVERAGVKAMIAQVIRFWPHYVAIKEMLERGQLGAPIMAQAARLGSQPTWSSWFADPQLSGGALLDLHIHDLDWLYYLFGRPRSVYAVGVRSANGAWDHVLTSLDYGRMKAAAEASSLMPNSYPFTMVFRMLGEQGYAEFRLGGTQSDPSAAARRDGLVVYQAGQPPQFPACSDEDPYLAEIRYFVDCLDEGKSPTIATLAEARTVLEIALAVRRSLETGKVVRLT